MSLSCANTRIDCPKLSENMGSESRVTVSSSVDGLTCPISFREKRPLLSIFQFKKSVFFVQFQFRQWATVSRMLGHRRDSKLRCLETGLAGFAISGANEHRFARTVLKIAQFCAQTVHGIHFSKRGCCKSQTRRSVVWRPFNSRRSPPSCQQFTVPALKSSFKSRPGRQPAFDRPAGRHHRGAQPRSDSRVVRRQPFAAQPVPAATVDLPMERAPGRGLERPGRSRRLCRDALSNI
jgi:hypothetical protein